MSRLASEYASRLPSLRVRSPLVRRSRGPSPGLLVAGVVAVAAGAVLFHVLAPDVYRYIKMRNM